MKALFNSSMLCPIVTALILGGVAGLHGVVTGAGDLHSLIVTVRSPCLSIVLVLEFSDRGIS